MELIVQNLSVDRGGVPVLQGVTFHLRAGDALIVRGPNGIGKTTLLRTIAGLQSPTSGEITCTDDSVAYAAHADGLKAQLTVAENLAFWAAIFGTEDISTALNHFGLDALEQRYAGSLSAGQKRKLGLARLMITRRPIWVLDEPTVSLDADAIALFSQMIKDHLAKGGIAVLATHIDLGLDARELDVSTYKAHNDLTSEDWSVGFT